MSIETTHQRKIILITGASGFLAKPLTQILAARGNTALILADIVKPETPIGSQFIDITDHTDIPTQEEDKTLVLPIKADLTIPDQVQSLFNTSLGVPDTVYVMHGIMSRGSEDNFKLGLKVSL